MKDRYSANQQKVKKLLVIVGVLSFLIGMALLGLGISGDSLVMTVVGIVFLIDSFVLPFVAGTIGRDRPDQFE